VVTGGPPGVDLATRAEVAAWRTTVLRWGSRHRRQLPWRETRDPWWVLVSEVMLQQTQVSRVAGPWRAFVRRFPTPARCAAVAPAEVVRAWEGLGYNRRALFLHRAARAVVDRHGGTVPSDLDALRALPGVGDYTARAVQAFAFEQPAAVVDTNVGRVLARAVAGRPLAMAEAQALADHLVSRRRPWEHNQTMLDLGAVVCTTRAPSCPRCPLRHRCRWRVAGHPEPDPARATAGASRRQSTFEGSARQGRGRLVAALRAGPVPADQLAAAAGWPGDGERAQRVADQLVAEGLARRAARGGLELT
jgi:A/G-specific adenine glycosylase